MTLQKREVFNIDDVTHIIRDAANEWHNKHPQNVVKERVNLLLDSKIEEVIAKLLGFNNNWGNWEVDHCNGRSGESAVGDYLRSVAKEAIQDYFRQINLPPLSKQVISSFKKEYKMELENNIRKQLRLSAIDEANKEVNNLMKEIGLTTLCDKIVEFNKLMDKK